MNSRTIFAIRTVVLLLLAGAAMSIALPTGPTVDEIKWTPDKRLSWEDFKGLPDRDSDKDALTESGITFSWGCDNRGFFAKTYAMFVPSKSWVKSPSQRLLKHEQTHFDISEIHARRIRKYFGEMRNPCWLGKEGINAAAKRIIQESYTMQNAYDTETRHSIREAEQLKWEVKVKEELDALAAWAE